MRLCLAVLAGLTLVPSAPAAAQPVRTVAVGSHIDWSYAQNLRPSRYRAGAVELTIEGRREADSPDLIVPVLTVAMPGLSSVQVEGAPTSATMEHRVSVGRWDAERLFVLFQSFSGGAHCCTEVELVYPENGRLQVVDLGEWDGGPGDELPTDRNGDGRLDFVFVDNAFYYAFASYADSWAPLTIRNIVSGEAVDVSADPSFRPLYEQELPRLRQACVAPGDGRVPNGACPAYVATAARVGQFDRAWAEMLRSYDRDFEWTLPGGCRTPRSEGACLEDDTIEYDNYPDALRGFLVDLGYIDR